MFQRASRAAWLRTWASAGPVLAVLSLAGPAFGATLRVPADFATIQAAIDAAVAGDEVLVAPGSYFESIDLRGKAIALRSEAGPSQTTIDGGGAPLYVLRITSGEGPGTSVEGFTITGGRAPTSGPGNGGGGIYVKGSSPVLTGLLVRANRGTEGAGMRIEQGSPLVIDSSFEENESITGGGIYALFAAAVLRDLRFRENRAIYGGGGLFAGGGSLVLERSEFEGNFAGSFGGALMLNTVSVQVSQVIARQNGDAEFLPDGSAVFHTFGGGGLYATNASGRIDRSLFVENVAAAGGGIYVAGAGSLQLVNCLSVENLSGIAGGGVYANGSSPTLVNCTVARNFPGGIFTTYGAFPTVRNSILAGNGREHYTNVDVYGNGLTNLAYSLTQDAVLAGGTLGAGMVVGDPLLGPAYQLLRGSPAIDAGRNSDVPAGVKIDYAGAARFVDDPATPDTGAGSPPLVDMGAIEYAPPMPMRFRR